MSPPVRAFKVSRLEHFLDFLLLEGLRRRGKRLRHCDVPVLAARVNDEIGHEIAVQGVYEKHLLHAITEFLLPRVLPDSKSSTALDVGANIGNHSVFLSRHFARVIAIEPNPSAAALLRANLAANAISNVDLQQVGLSDEDGSLPFVEDTFNLGGSHFLPAEKAMLVSGGRLLPVMKGDGLVSSLYLRGRIGLIKLDVEGLETKVIAGFRETLLQHKPLVLFEAWTGRTAAEISENLRAVGYRFFYSVDRPRLRTPSRWIRGLHRMLYGADIYVEQIHSFEDQWYPLAAATCSPIEIGR